jgi:hypothetical protein
MPPLPKLFLDKYTEFAVDLLKTCPELKSDIDMAMFISDADKVSQFRERILPSCSPKRDPKSNPGPVLPGVFITDELWESFSQTTKSAIQQHLTVLSFCLLVDMGTKDDFNGSDWTESWAKKMLGEMKEKMGGIDFMSFGEKISKMFSEGKGFPELPEQFKKGQIARLAEEIVKELNLEDIGLTAEDIEESKKNPAKTFEIMMNLFGKNSNILQGTVQKLSKKLQQKIQSGAIRPKELMAEAQELMKLFSDNPQFVEMMETFRNAFGAREEEFERAAGRQPDGRMSLVKERLRKKLAERKKAEEMKKNK